MSKENSWLATYKNIKFYPFNPNPADVDLEDIAQSLSFLCRFNGHCTSFYSVAQHSILVARALLEDGESDRVALVGLLHDAGEAYLGDIPSPIKRYIPELEIVEMKILQAVFEGLNVEYPSDEEWIKVMKMDKAILAAEGVYLTNNIENWTERYKSSKTSLFRGDGFRARGQLRVKNEFMELFDKLK